MSVPRWLHELERTSLVFWKDGQSLTWPQALTLLVSTASFFVLAQRPFAGGATFLDPSSFIVVFEIVVACILVLTAGRLGPLEAWAPNLVRLLIVHLVLAMVFLSTNNLWQWAKGMASDFCIAAVPTVCSTLALAWYSYRRSADGTRLVRQWSFYGSMCLVTLITGLVTYYSVIPSSD